MGYTYYGCSFRKYRHEEYDVPEEVECSVYKCIQLQNLFLVNN